MPPESSSKPRSLLVMGGVYTLVLALSLVIGARLPTASPLLTAAVVDLIATLLVFGFSVVCDNSSLYDPFWSVAPIAIVAYWVADAGVSPRGLLVMVLVTVWGCRLTANFLRHWRGLGHEDWRYVELRMQTGKLYWVVSLFGVHLLPTLIVFAATVPVYFAIRARSALTILDFVAAAVVLSAIVVEAVADLQMRAFRSSGGGGGRTFRGGLWAWSRHPNYLGEMVFWWGLYLFTLAADATAWWTIFGPLGVTVLFLAVSVPLIEARMLARYPDYEQVRRETSVLLPWFPRRP